MVANLPIEVILEISHYLEFEDKINFISTCHRIYDVIAKTSLYVDLNLLPSKDSTERIIKLFESKRLEGSQVRILRFKARHIRDRRLLSRLSAIFPNVTRIINRKEASYSNYTIQKTDTISSSMKQWINTIENYNMFSDWYNILPALRRHTFPKLTELKLGYAFDFKKKVIGLDPLCFLPFVKNAPLLTTLRLWNCNINLEFLEEMHNSCPHIKSLKLINVVIAIDESALPEKIIPANKVSKLAFNYVLILDECGIFLDYILCKYPNLYHFKMDLIDHPEFAQASLCRFYQTGRNEYQGEIDSKVEIFKSTFKKHCANGPKFLLNLPSTIKVLKLKVSISENLLEDISNSNINPKTLKLQHRGRSYGSVFTESDEIKYIQNFTQLRTFKAIIDSSVLANNRDFASTSVTTLFVQISGDASLSDSFNMEWLLSMFPSLEELYMDYSAMGIGGKIEAARKTYPNLRIISITDCGVHQSFFNYIKAAAPNIRELELTIDNRSAVYFYSHGDELEHKIHIDLTGLNLERCELLLEDESLSGNHEFKCTIKIKNRSKKVIFHQRNKALGFPPLDDDDDDDDDDNVGSATKTTILCDEIKDFTINGYSVRMIDHQVFVGL